MIAPAHIAVVILVAGALRERSHAICPVLRGLFRSPPYVCRAARLRGVGASRRAGRVQPGLRGQQCRSRDLHGERPRGRSLERAHGIGGRGECATGCDGGTYGERALDSRRSHPSRPSETGASASSPRPFGTGAVSGGLSRSRLPHTRKTADDRRKIASEPRGRALRLR
jgi:hypothetical protein